MFFSSVRWGAIKVKQETESGTIESESFIVTYTEEGYVCTWLDTDEDGLPDYAEKIYGIDPENPDTDSDGLSDYDELYTVGTSPLKYDTDEDGTNDADSDLDSDGLTNAQELELGTSPSSADTDGDTLSDYAELYETDTDPLKTDTDGDTLSDSDDIALGLDPNNPETFGVPDAEYKVEQTISADSEVMERVNTDEAPYELSLEITASGNVGTNLIAGNSIYSTITESDARLGGAVSLSYYGGEVDKVKLIYEVGDDYISNDGSEYAANCVDLQGIKRYNIFRYFEDVNMLLPVATEFDVENNTLYAETDELGTYCVLDMEVLLENFGIAPDGTQMKTVMEEYYSAAEVSEVSVTYTETEDTLESNNAIDSDAYFITFILDIRSDKFTSTQLRLIKNQVREFARTVYVEEKDITICLMTQDVSEFDGNSSEIIGIFKSYDEIDEALGDISLSEKIGLFDGYCVVTDALSSYTDAIEVDASEKNYIFSVYSQENAIFEQNIVNDVYNSAKGNNINISIISESSDDFTGYQKQVTDDTSGIIINSFTDFSGTVYEHIFGETYEEKFFPEEPQSAFDAILLTGYERITLDSILYPNGENPTGVDSDTDKDTLTDWDEVDVERWETAGLITIEDNGYINLPTLQQCMDYTELSYVEEGLNRFLGAYNVTNLLGDIRVLPISSDPTHADSDGDGIADEYDPHKLLAIDIDTPCLYNDNIHGAENHILISDGTGNAYICANCDMAPLAAPETEDRENLSDDDYMTVQVLLSIYRYFIQIQDYSSADSIYASIDKIRYYKTLTGKQYSCSDQKGDYYSPILYKFIDNENDYYITIDVLDTTYHNRHINNIMTATFFVGDILLLCIPTTTLASKLICSVAGITFAFIKEAYYSYIDEREFSIPVFIESIIPTVVDIHFKEGFVCSSLMLSSYINKLAVSNFTDSNDRTGAIYKDYCVEITIKGNAGEKTFSYSAKQIDLNSAPSLNVYKANELPEDNFYLSNTAVVLYEMREWSEIQYFYKNTLFFRESDMQYYDYERIWGIVGCYYQKMNTSGYKFYWEWWDERTNQLYESQQ